MSFDSERHDRLIALEIENARLRSALAPFARAADLADQACEAQGAPPVSDEQTIDPILEMTGETPVLCTMADMRVARSLLREVDTSTKRDDEAAGIQRALLGIGLKGIRTKTEAALATDSRGPNVSLTSDEATLVHLLLFGGGARSTTERLTVLERAIERITPIHDQIVHAVRQYHGVPSPGLENGIEIAASHLLDLVKAVRS